MTENTIKTKAQDPAHYTRQDYMVGKCTHRQYYAQFVNDEVKELVKESINVDKTKSIEILKEALVKDENLNNIPLYKWDSMARQLHISLKPYGDYLTLAGGVCILKEAARQLVEEMEVK